MVPAWKAWTMNSYCSTVAMSASGFQLSGGVVSATLRKIAGSIGVGMVGLLLQPDDEDPAAPVADHLDRRRVDAAQRLARDDLLRRADRDPALGDVDHLVQP